MQMEWEEKGIIKQREGTKIMEKEGKGREKEGKGWKGREM